MAFILSVGIFSAVGCGKESVPSTDDLPITAPTPNDDGGSEDGGSSNGGSEDGGSSNEGGSPSINGGNGPIVFPNFPTP